MRQLTLVVLVVLASTIAGGCASSGKTSGAGELDKGPPFTAAEIRDANTPGTTLTFRIEQEGEPVSHRTMRFEGDSKRNARIVSTMTTPTGQPIGDSETTESTWEELRDHAAFDPALTRRSNATRKTSLGRINCWLYEVADPDDTAKLNLYFFSKSRPGPPVLYEVIREGKVVFKMEMIEDSRR